MSYLLTCRSALPGLAQRSTSWTPCSLGQQKSGARAGGVIRGEASAVQCDRTYSARDHPRPAPTSRRSALGISHRRNPSRRAPASRDPVPMGSGPLHPRRQVRLRRERPIWVRLRRHPVVGRQTRVEDWQPLGPRTRGKSGNTEVQQAAAWMRPHREGESFPFSR